MTHQATSPPQPILVYQTEDGLIRVDVLMEARTVWLSQGQMAELFDTSRPNVTQHIRHVFAEGELVESAVCKDYLLTAADGKQYNTRHYNLDVIISVGYRVKSLRGTQFRIWATKLLNEYLTKGFSSLPIAWPQKACIRWFGDSMAAFMSKNTDFFNATSQSS